MSKYSEKAKKNRSRSGTEYSVKVDPAVLESEITTCPKCTIEVKSKNLEGHLKKVHDAKMIIKGQTRKNMMPLLVVATVILLVLAGGSYYLIGNSDRNTSDNSNVENSDPTPSGNWLDNYYPLKNVGSAEDQWWTYYPVHNPDGGSIPDHPGWIRELLRDGPVIVFTHSTSCGPCVQQEESINKVMRNFRDDIRLIDLLSGMDEQASEMFNIYDPNGPPGYIPLTTILTLVQGPSGNVEIGWHGAEGATGDDWLTSYIKDAIYYHSVNGKNWG